MTSDTPIAGLGAIVLCGGASSRMGQAKAWLPFGDATLLQRVTRTVALVASPVVVVAAPGQALPPLDPAIAIAVDAVTGRGPLQGILAGLTAMGGQAEHAFVSSTDAPFLHPALVRRLAALRDEGDHDAVVPRTDGHLHALAAVYRCGVRGEIAAMVDAGRLRMSLVFERVRTLVADADLLLACPALRAADPALASLRNVNTPGEYEAALRDAHLAP